MRGSGSFANLLMPGGSSGGNRQRLGCIGPYSDDSNVCLAARHAGLVDATKPVNVTINFMDGPLNPTRASTANGVESARMGHLGRKLRL